MQCGIMASAHTQGSLFTSCIRKAIIAAIIAFSYRLCPLVIYSPDSCHILFVHTAYHLHGFWSFQPFSAIIEMASDHIHKAAVLIYYHILYEIAQSTTSIGATEPRGCG